MVKKTGRDKNTVMKQNSDRKKSKFTEDVKANIKTGRCRSENGSHRDADGEYFDVIVVGAGASGLMAAISAAGAGAKVAVIDGNDKAGKKIFATGNGRCNFTNINCGVKDFNAGSEDFVSEALKAFDAKRAVVFFESCGMIYREEDEGRCYPYSSQAAAVVSALVRRADAAGVVFVLENRVESIQSAEQMAESKSCKDRFTVVCESGRSFVGGALVIACGGRAGLKFGSTGDGYGFAKAFGHALVPPRPALVAVESGDADMQKLKGVRAKASVTLFENGKSVAEENGEVQFTGSGISGICVFDLTRFMDAPRPSKKKKAGKDGSAQEASDVKKYKIAVDFVPDFSQASLEDRLKDFAAVAVAAKKKNDVKYDMNFNKNSKNANNHIDCGAGKDDVKTGCCEYTDEENNVGYSENTECGKCSSDIVSEMSRAVNNMSDVFMTVMSGIVNAKIAAVMADRLKDAVSIGEAAEKAASYLKNFEVNVLSTRGWEEAQVTCGGVKCSEINAETMESKLKPGLFFAGEVMDVDGKCGGYNLQWAWSSGYLAGKNAADRRNKC